MHYSHKDCARNSLVCQIHCDALLNSCYRHRSVGSSSCTCHEWCVTNFQAADLCLWFSALPTCQTSSFSALQGILLLAIFLLSSHLNIILLSFPLVILFLLPVWTEKKKNNTWLKASKSNFILNTLHQQKMLVLSKRKAVPTHLNPVKSREHWQ